MALCQVEHHHAAQRRARNMHAECKHGFNTAAPHAGPVTLPQAIVTGQRQRIRTKVLRE